MLLDEYLGKIETKKAILTATSFYDYPWRQRSGVVFLKLVKNSLQGVPVELLEDCVVSKDALHLLNIYQAFKDPANIKEFQGVLGAAGKWQVDEYAAFHLRMYATSFCHMKLMVGHKPDAEVHSAKESKIVFVPVFSVDDADERFVVIRENLKCYEVSEGKGNTVTDKYLGLSVHEGFQASRGEQPEQENMVGYGW